MTGAQVIQHPTLTRLLLSVKIGSTEEAIARLERDLAEDEAVLALIHDGTPPDSGWRDEDECAAFVASSQRKLTALHAGLAGLYEKLAGLEAQVPA